MFASVSYSLPSFSSKASSSQETAGSIAYSKGSTSSSSIFSNSSETAGSVACSSSSPSASAGSSCSSGFSCMA